MWECRLNTDRSADFTGRLHHDAHHQVVDCVAADRDAEPAIEKERAEDDAGQRSKREAEPQ